MEFDVLTNEMHFVMLVVAGLASSSGIKYNSWISLNVPFLGCTAIFGRGSILVCIHGMGFWTVFGLQLFTQCSTWCLSNGIPLII